MTISDWSWKTFFQLEDVTDEEWNTAKYLAGSWQSCAVHEVHPTLRRSIFGPEDAELYQLGLEFSEQIEAERFDASKKLFEQIEAH